VEKLLVAAALTIAAATCALVALVRWDPPAPSILLITLDTTRADHLGLYGYPKPTSPRLDRLARTAVVFEQAFSPATTSGPAHASMMTGLRPARHGAQHNGEAMSPEVRTVAERLRDAGYHTGGFVSHPLVGAKAGLDRGFDTFVVRTDSNHRHRVPERARSLRVFAQAADWLRAHPNRTFTWVHAQHPHFDYRPPVDLERRFGGAGHTARGKFDCAFAIKEAIEKKEPIPDEARRDTVARYDGEIALVDEGIGMLLDALAASGNEGRTTVIVVADHGETLFDRTDVAQFGHGYKFFEEVLRVPLVLRVPAAPPARLRGFVESTAIAETIAEITGLPALEAPDPTRTPSLLAAVRAGRGAEVFPPTAWPGHTRRAVRVGAHKLVVRPDGKELYDLDQDPGERTDRAAQEPERVAMLARKLEELEAQAIRPSRAATDPETLEMLREGGYLDDVKAGSSQRGGKSDATR
jgi:arylsulfatase A-like enzyme